MSNIRRRLRYWLDSAKRSEALLEEMELHLAEKAAELQADGMTAESAKAEARRGVSQHRLPKRTWSPAPRASN